VAAAAGLAVAAGGSAVGVAAAADNGVALRLAAVTRGNVTQTIDTSGTITSSVKYTPSFASAGTVRKVDVAVGDTVRKGETLATLDTTSLRAALDAAKATLARDRQQLEADETGQTSSGTDATAQTISFIRPLGASPTAGSPSGPTTGDLVAQVKAAQAAVVAAQQALDAGQADVDAAQQTVDKDVTTNTELRDAQVTACGATTPPAAPSTDCTSAMAAYQASADALAADVAKLDATITTQDTNTKTLDASITTLDGLVHKLKSTTSGGSSSTPTQGSGSTPHAGNGTTPSSGSTKSPSSTSGSSNSSGATSQPASAAQLAADQAAIDAARAQVRVAAQDLDAATLTSPINGRVAAIGLTAGTSSSGQTITIVGTGVQGVSVTVPLPQIDEVKVGQAVTVSADGHPAALHGTVTSIGLVSSTSGSTATFPVTVRFDAGSARLYDGTGADVVITTGTARNVPVVPNSAIHSGLRGAHTVTVVRKGSTTDVPVTVGLAGSDVTQIKTGLAVGDRVEVADPGEQLPASTSSSNSGFRFGGVGGFGRLSVGGG
jgi:HlyD family secretion protein